MLHAFQTRNNKIYPYVINPINSNHTLYFLFHCMMNICGGFIIFRNTPVWQHTLNCFLNELNLGPTQRTLIFLNALSVNHHNL